MNPKDRCKLSRIDKALYSIRSSPIYIPEKHLDGVDWHESRLVTDASTQRSFDLEDCALKAEEISPMECAMA